MATRSSSPALPSTDVRVPALTDALVKLLALKAADRENLRLLELLALKDPAAVARLITLANSAFYARSRPAETVSDALQTMGSRSAYEALLLVWLQQAVSPSPRFAKAMAYLVRHTFAMSATLHRMEAHMPPNRLPQGVDLGLLAIFDKLGLSFFLSDELSPSAEAREVFLQCAEGGVHLLRAASALEVGFACSTRIAKAWAIDAELQQALQALGGHAVGETDVFEPRELLQCAEAVLQERAGTTVGLLDELEETQACGQRVVTFLREKGVKPVSLARAL